MNEQRRIGHNVVFEETAEWRGVGSFECLVAALPEIDDTDYRGRTQKLILALHLPVFLLIAERVKDIFRFDRGLPARFESENEIDPRGNPARNRIRMQEVPHFVDKIVGVAAPVSGIYRRYVPSIGCRHCRETAPIHK
jgi:hypothetical protein